MKIIVSLLLLVLYSSLLAEMTPSYIISDTPVIVSKCNTHLFKEDELYFPIQWYDGYTAKGELFGLTKWAPYAPSFEQAYGELKIKDSYHRIKKIYEDSIATGIILYNRLSNNEDEALVRKLVNEFNLEFYLTIYGMKNNRSYPLETFPPLFEEYKDNPRVNWYFNDDIHKENWNNKSTERFYNLLKERTPTKYLLSACSILNYKDSEKYLLDYVDIIAPQIYPCRKRLLIYKNLDEAIPEFYNHTKFHKSVLKGKKIVNEYNKRHSKKIYYFVTLATYHINKKIVKLISRFPTYKEFRYQFYDAIIGGAKGINIYCFYRSNKEAYENAKKIIEEFRQTGFEKAVILGKYYPQEIVNDSLLINNDIKNKYGKDLWDCDYTIYQYKDVYYLIISNNSNIPYRVPIIFRHKKMKRVFEIFSNENGLVEKVEYDVINGEKFLVRMVPYEIKLVTIQISEK